MTKIGSKLYEVMLDDELLKRRLSQIRCHEYCPYGNVHLCIVKDKKTSEKTRTWKEDCRRAEVPLEKEKGELMDQLETGRRRGRPWARWLYDDAADGPLFFPRWSTTAAVPSTVAAAVPSTTTAAAQSTATTGIPMLVSISHHLF